MKARKRMRVKSVKVYSKRPSQKSAIKNLHARIIDLEASVRILREKAGLPAEPDLTESITTITPFTSFSRSPGVVHGWNLSYTPPSSWWDRLVAWWRA